MAEAKLVSPDGRSPQYNSTRKIFNRPDQMSRAVYIRFSQRSRDQLVVHFLCFNEHSRCRVHCSANTPGTCLHVLHHFSGSFDHLECANVQYTLSGNFHCCCCSSWHSRYVKAAMDGPHRLHLRKERYNAYYTFFYCYSASSDRKALSPCIPSWSISPMLVSLIISSARTCFNDQRCIPEASASAFSKSIPPIRLFHTNSQFA